MSNVKFGKVENNPATGSATPAGTIEMGIQNAPSRLIVKYITDMYSSPLEAAIRETISNACDAAIKNGRSYNDGVHASVYNREPYSPFFEVRDLGEGMDRDKLVNVYTQYGVSDKRDEDASLGAFGLGAKSPLAYTNEFEVITRTKADGTMYVHCYRTPDDDFLADTPISISGKETVADNLRRMKGNPGAVIVIEDPFDADETGTIVRFPLTTTEDEHKAKAILKKVDELLYNCGEGSISSEKYDYEPAYYCVGEYDVADDDGSTITARIYMQDTAPGSALSYIRVNKPLGSVLSTILHKGEILDAETTCFKVGNWCYPADGSPWLYSRHGGSEVGAKTSHVIIDVPSKALPFVPSRDTIRDDNANAYALLKFATERVREFVAERENMTDLFKWAAAGSTFPKAIDAVFDSSHYSFDADKLAEEKILRVVDKSPEIKGDLEIDITKIDGIGGYTVAQVLDSKPALVGLVERPLGNSKMKNGPLLCTPSPVAWVCGTFARSLEGSLPGWGYAKTKTCGDALTADSSQVLNTCEYATAEMKARNAKFAKNGGSPTPSFPAGAALMHIASDHNAAKANAFAIIDGSKTAISKIRLGIGRIFDNNDLLADAKSAGYFAIIPPKGAGQAWTDAELAEQVEFLKQVGEAIAPGHVVYIPEEKLAASLAKLDKGAISSQERGELEKMLNVNRQMVLADATGRNTRQALRRLRGKGEVAAKIEADPTSWGLVVADAKAYGQPYEVAADYARVAFALGVVPSRITNIVCIGSNHYNAKRAKMLNNIGVDVIYDESGITPFDTVMESGVMDYAQHRVRYTGDNVPDDIIAYASNEAIERIESDIARVWESEMRSYSYTYRFNRTAVDEDDTPSTAQFVDALSFGRESFPEFSASKTSVAGWQREVLSGIIFESESAHVEHDLTELKEKLAVIVKIWVGKGAQAGLEWNTSKWTVSNLPIILGTAEGAGISSALEAYYSGVPYEDLMI